MYLYIICIYTNIYPHTCIPIYIYTHWLIELPMTLNLLCTVAMCWPSLSPAHTDVAATARLPCGHRVAERAGKWQLRPAARLTGFLADVRHTLNFSTTPMTKKTHVHIWCIYIYIYMDVDAWQL